MRSDFCLRLPQPSTPFLHPAKSQISAGDIQFIAYKHVLITCSSPSPAKELPVTSSTASLAQHCNLEAGSNSPASLFNDRFKVSKLARGDMSGSVASWFKETSSSFKLFKVSRGGKLVNWTKHLKQLNIYGKLFSFTWFPFSTKEVKLIKLVTSPGKLGRPAWLT